MNFISRTLLLSISCIASASAMQPGQIPNECHEHIQQRAQEWQTNELSSLDDPYHIQLIGTILYLLQLQSQLRVELEVYRSTLLQDTFNALSAFDTEQDAIDSLCALVSRTGQAISGSRYYRTVIAATTQCEQLLNKLAPEDREAIDAALDGVRAIGRETALMISDAFKTTVHFSIDELTDIAQQKLQKEQDDIALLQKTITNYKEQAEKDEYYKLTQFYTVQNLLKQNANLGWQALALHAQANMAHITLLAASAHVFNACYEYAQRALAREDIPKQYKTLLFNPN